MIYSFVNRAKQKLLLRSPLKFEKRGQCGTEISELLPNIAEIAEDMCLVRSMHTGHNGHEVSIRYFHGGIPAQLGRPHVASWLLYGLGSETQNLPAYVVLTDPGDIRWMESITGRTAGCRVFIRAQSSAPRTTHPQSRPAAESEGGLSERKSRSVACVEQQASRADRRLQRSRSANRQLRNGRAHADIRQEALDISQETEATQKLYGLDNPETQEYGRAADCPPFGRAWRALRAALPGGQPWDNHTGIQASCRRSVNEPTSLAGAR